MVNIIQLWHQIGWPTSLIFYGYLLNVGISNKAFTPVLIGTSFALGAIIFVRIHTWKLDEAVRSLYPRLIFLELLLDFHFYRDILRKAEKRTPATAKTFVEQCEDSLATVSDDTTTTELWKKVSEAFKPDLFPSGRRAHNRLTWAAGLMAVGLIAASTCVFLLLSCTREQGKPLTSAPSPSSSKSAAISVPRGITGLEVGMTPEQIGQLFTIKEDQDPVSVLLKKYVKPDQGEAVSRRNEAIQKRFFRISSGVGKLPDGVTSADTYATHNIVYQISLHYDTASGKKIGWESLTYPYVVKYGKPSEETGSGYIWKDGRTRLQIEASGSMINVFFTDEALEIEMKKEERKQQ